MDFLQKSLLAAHEVLTGSFVFVNQVARKIKVSGHQLCLLVLDAEEYERAVSRGQDLRNLASAHTEKTCKAPRLCFISRDRVSGLGIHFTPQEGNTTGPRLEILLCRDDDGAVLLSLFVFVF